MGAQAGVRPGDVIVSANQTDLSQVSGCDAQKVILRIATDLDLVIKRNCATARKSDSCAPELFRVLARSEEIESPRKIARSAMARPSFSSSSSESSEDCLSDELGVSEELHGSNRLNNRLRGMDAHLKFDDGIRPCSILREGREFVYSGSVKVTISGTLKPQISLIWAYMLHFRDKNN